MSNPTNLQELADALAAQAHTVRQEASNPRDGLSFRSHKIGYADALLDTRATVLAMIADVDRRIAANNQKASTEVHQGVLDGRIEAYEDVRGDTVQCDVCGAFGCKLPHPRFRGGDEVNNASPAVVGPLNESLAGTNLHKASPDPDYPHLCIHCMLYIKQVPGGQGTTWIHEATGRVVGKADDAEMVRYQYQVLVDGTPMQHGPFDPTSAHHPRSAAATYQDINPEATVTIEYRDNEGDGVWTTNEPNGLPA